MPSKFQESAWLVYHYSGERSMSVISRSRRRSRTADVHLALHGQNRDGNYQRVTATMKTDPVSNKPQQQREAPGQSASFQNPGLHRPSAMADGSTLLAKLKLTAASSKRLREQEGESAKPPRRGQLIDILV